MTASIGRPFIVDFVERRALLEERSDWLEDLAPLSMKSLDEGRRAALAAYWADVALAAHASISAFARFTLQLVSVCAPPELLALSRQAQADEMKHARLSFTLASRYGGRDVGPGHLSFARALDNLSLENIIVTTILESCIGQARSALEASRSRDMCDDPVVSAVFAQIAKEETEHASLAWRFVGWFLEEYPEFTALFVQTIAVAREARPRSFPEGRFDLSSFGVLDAEQRAQVDAELWNFVIEPSASALLDMLNSSAWPWYDPSEGTGKVVSLRGYSNDATWVG